VWTCLVADILKKKKIKNGCFNIKWISYEKMVNFEYKNTLVFKVILTIISKKYTIPPKLNALQYVTIMLMPLLLYNAQQH
jgi:hypothetical protein